MKRDAAPKSDDDDESTKKKKGKSIIVDAGSTYVTGSDPSKVWVITKNCPNNCNKRGLCLNSTCFCDQGKKKLTQVIHFQIVL